MISKQDQIVLSLLVANLILEPTMAFGMSLGLAGFCIMFGMLLFSFVLAAAFWTQIFNWRRVEWDVQTSILYCLTAVVTALVVNSGVAEFANREWGTGEIVVQAKIEYFCYKHFHAERCVQQVQTCPRCAVEMDKWKRNIVIQRLRVTRERIVKAQPPVPAGIQATHQSSLKMVAKSNPKNSAKVSASNR